MPTKNHTRRRVLGAAGSLAAVGLAGCIATARDAEETVEETTDGESVQTVSVAGGAGSITVASEDRADVVVDGVRRAASEDALGDVELDATLDEATGHLDVSVDRPSESILQLGPSPVMDLDVIVPEGTAVTRATTGSGTVLVADVEGPTTATAGSGTVDVNAVSGNVVTETGSGDVTIEEHAHGLDASVGSGSIQADFAELAGSVSIDVRSGNASLTLPANLDARFDVSTGSGTVSTSGLDAGGTDTDSGLQTTVGDGEHTISIVTGSGNVSIDVVE